MTNLVRALRDAGLVAALPVAACSPAEGQAASGGAMQSKAGSEVADANALVRAAIPIRGHPSDYDALISAAGRARFVLLGEATHGTHEFYRERARISMRLMLEKDFRAVVIEGDWPDAGRVNRYVRGLGQDRTAEDALGDFSDFPIWMWRNAEFRDFIESLRTHNMTVPAAQRIGVYGMDVYNLFGAADAVVDYLKTVDQAGAELARAYYRCFAPYRGDSTRYGQSTRRPGKSCELPAMAVLDRIRALPSPTDPTAAEALFSAVRSAASVVGAEEFYRTAYSGSLSWNVRDRRMAATVSEVSDHVGSLSGAPGRVIVWAHNSHVGDARATDMPSRGELNLGQLMRERFGDAAYLVGFTTYEGTAVAANEWAGPHRVHKLNAALPGSYAGQFHAAGLRDALLLTGNPELAQVLGTPRPKREVGVIYARATERRSHYMQARLAQQFDAVIHLDRTRALTPLL